MAGGWRSASDLLEENEDRAAKVAARHAGLRKGEPVDCPAPECTKTEGHVGRHNKQGRADAKPRPVPPGPNVRGEKPPAPASPAIVATMAAGELVEVVVKLRVSLEDLIRIARKAGR